MRAPDLEIVHRRGLASPSLGWRCHRARKATELYRIEQTVEISCITVRVCSESELPNEDLPYRPEEVCRAIFCPPSSNTVCVRAVHMALLSRINFGCAFPDAIVWQQVEQIESTDES